MTGRAGCLAILLIAVALLPACSLKKFAVNRVGDAIASGGETYESDEDIELVGEALPFSLKLLESLLEVSPRHGGMLQTACQGFTTYAYIYVQQEADALAFTDFRRSRELRARARRLYMRASGYGLRGLERYYRGKPSELERNPAAALAAVKKNHIPLLYWNAAALGLAISVSKDRADMLARIPELEAMLDRALELDPTWEEGALYDLRIMVAGARPEPPDGSMLRQDFDRALQLSRGQRAGTYVAYAESWALRQQDRGQFEKLLKSALDIDSDARPSTRLANLVAQRRARMLLERVDDLILEDQEPEVVP